MEVFPENTVFEAEENQTVIADGVSKSEGIQLRTFDFCENIVTSGGLASDVQAIFVEEPNATTGLFSGRRLSSVIPVVITVEADDNNDGTYGIPLVTSSIGTFSLYYAFGKECDLTYMNDTNTVEFGSNPGCIFGTLSSAVRALPVPPVPTPAPTILVLPPTSTDETGAVVASTGGAVIGAAVVVAVFLAVVYRRRWLKDKQVIEEGLLYQMDANTLFSASDPLSRVGNKVMTTRAAINRLRAQGVAVEGSAVVAKMEKDNEDLKQEVARLKITEAKAERGTSPFSEEGIHRPNKKIAKREF